MKHGMCEVWCEMWNVVRRVMWCVKYGVTCNTRCGVMLCGIMRAVE